MIPLPLIAEVRSRARIEDVIGRAVQLQRKGRRMVGLCPFHQEKTPSFSVSVDKQLYHCFGCKASGDALDFIQQHEGLDFLDALRRLAGEVGVDVGAKPETPEEKATRLHRGAQFEANKIASTYFAEALLSPIGATALRYLTTERGLSVETVQAWGLGWAPAPLVGLAQRLQRAGLDLAGLDVGLLGRSQGGSVYDRNRQRVMFPIVLPGGNVAGFGARRADWVSSTGPKYINSPESTCYDKSSVLFGFDQARDTMRRSKVAVVVEGYLDVIGLHQAGVTGAVATCGTSLTPKHAALLSRTVSDVVLMFDGDAAGVEAVTKVALVLLAHGLTVRWAPLPAGDDPDTFARREGAERTQALIAGARGVVDEVLRTSRGAGLAGTTRALERVRPLLLASPDPLVRDVQVATVARELGVTDAAVLGRPGQSATSTPAPRTPTPNAGTTPLDRAVARVMGVDALAFVDALVDAGLVLTHPALGAVVTEALAAIRGSTVFSAAEVRRVLLSHDHQDAAQLAECVLSDDTPAESVPDMVEMLKQRDRAQQARAVRAQATAAGDMDEWLARLGEAEGYER